MKRLFTLIPILIFSYYFAGFFVTGVDASDYPNVVVSAVADVPDPENMDIKVFEDNEGFDVTYLGLIGREPPAKVDIIFVFDITGSMEDEIRSMIRKSEDFADEVASGGFDYRFSLVTFRDRVEKGDYGFTSDVSTFKEWLSSLIAKGGGDTPEGDLDAMMYAMRLPARKDAQKVLILITDAPYHYRGDGTKWSRYTVKNVREMMRRLGYSIYAISPDSKQYRDLVIGFGKLFDIHSGKSFSEIVDEIAKAIKSQFRFSYTTVDRPARSVVTFQVKAFYNGAEGRKKLEAAGTYEVPIKPTVEEEEVEVEGYSVIDPTLPQGKAVVLAKRAAEIDAKRQILEFVKGVKIDSETTVGDAMSGSDKIKSAVEGWIRGAEVVEEGIDKDFGMYYVKMKADFKYIVNKISGKPTYTISSKANAFIVRGIVVINKKVHPISRAVLMARRGAVVDAQRRLLEVIKGVHIDAKTTVEDLEETHDVVMAKVEGTVKGAVIIDEMKNHRSLSDIYKLGYYWVTMAVPLDKSGMEYLKEKYGKFGGGSVVEALKDYVKPEVEKEKKPSGWKEKKVGKVTRLIVDAEGKGVLLLLTGYKLYSKEGKLVFTPEMVKKGILPMRYVPTLEMAKKPVGPNDRIYVVRAVKVEGNSIYLDKDYDTLATIIYDYGVGESGNIVVAGIKMKAER